MSFMVSILRRGRILGQHNLSWSVGAFLTDTIEAGGLTKSAAGCVRLGKLSKSAAGSTASRTRMAGLGRSRIISNPVHIKSF